MGIERKTSQSPEDDKEAIAEFLESAKASLNEHREIGFIGYMISIGEDDEREFTAIRSVIAGGTNIAQLLTFKNVTGDEKAFESIKVLQQVVNNIVEDVANVSKTILNGKTKEELLSEMKEQAMKRMLGTLASFGKPGEA